MKPFNLQLLFQCEDRASVLPVWRGNESVVGGNKSRTPRGFITQLHLPLPLCQQMQKYSLHAWGVLRGSRYRFDLSGSSPRIDHIDCLFFLKSVTRHTLRDVKGQIQCGGSCFYILCRGKVLIMHTGSFLLVYYGIGF